MKKLLILLFCIPIVLHGQTFDFYGKKLIGDSCKIANKSFTLVVKNINTFQYDVLIDNTPVNYNQEVPTLIKEYLLNAKEAKGAKDTVKTKSVTKETPGIVPPTMVPSVSIDELKSKYFRLKGSEQFYSLLNELLHLDLPGNRIIDFKKSYFQKFIGVKAENDESDVATLVGFYSKLMDEIPIDASQLKASLKSETDRALVTVILQYTHKVDSLQIPIRLAALYSKINEQAFSVSAFIRRPDADDLIVSITAKPKTEVNGSKREIRLEIPFVIKSGFKVDFSTGIFLSNVADHEYVNQPQFEGDLISGYHLVKSEANPLSYGIAGYMHGYCRNGADLNLGFTLGVGIDQHTQVKMMPGISLLLGRKERFILNGGMVVGKVKYLSPVQDVSHLYKEKAEPVYTEAYKIGWFAGISYNLSK